MGVPLEANDPVCVVSSENVPGAQQPRVAIDPEGTIYVAFGANEYIYVCKSVDEGKTYTVPVKVGHVAKLALGMRRGPRIVANENSIVVTAISHASGNLMAWRSVDRGESWGRPTDINDQPKIAREGLHGMAIGPDGLVFCTWLDLRNDLTQIYGASSQDGGQTWSENRRVYASPSGTVCECCSPSVAISDNGIIYVMWRNALDGNRDMFLAKSEDSGQTFNIAEKLGIGSWKLNACPMDGGDLTVAPDGQPLTVWRRNQQIFATDVGGLMHEQLLGSGEQPSLAANVKGHYLVWVERRGADLLLLTPKSNTPSRLAERAADPVIAAPRLVKGPVVAVWESGEKPDVSIMATVVSD
ncbi:MAG: sialidase family protein [Aureliella sp.]